MYHSSKYKMQKYKTRGNMGKYLRLGWVTDVIKNTKALLLTEGICKLFVKNKILLNFLH